MDRSTDFERQLLTKMLSLQETLSRARRARLHVQAQLASLEADERELTRLYEWAECLDEESTSAAEGDNEPTEKPGAVRGTEAKK